MKTKTVPLETFDFFYKTKSVLLIDNNDIDLFVNQKELENYGVTNIHSFRRGNDALLHLKETEIKYHLILIDVYLPIMDGFEFLDKFMELGLNKKHGEICLLSASINPFHLQKSKEISVRFIEKPLTIEKLLLSLNKEY